MMRALTPRGIHQGLSLRPTVSICSASRSSNMDAKQSKSITPSKRKFKNSDEQTQTDRDKETKDHWFVALMLPTELTTRVNDVVQELSSRFNTRVSTAAPHITLIPPFHATKFQLECLKADLKEFSANQEPFQVQLKGFSAFPKRVLYVDVATTGALVPMKSSLDSALHRSRSFLPPPRGRFVPHVSVASKKVKQSAFDSAWEELCDKDFEGSWCAAELTLLLFEDNKQWVEMERFPLEGNAD